MDREIEYYQETYGEDSRQVWSSLHGKCYEPNVGLLIFKKMMTEYEDKIDILLEHRLEVVKTRFKTNNYSQVEAVRVKDIKSKRIHRLEGSIFMYPNQ